MFNIRLQDAFGDEVRLKLDPLGTRNGSETPTLQTLLDPEAAVRDSLPKFQYTRSHSQVVCNEDARKTPASQVFKSASSISGSRNDINQQDDEKLDKLLFQGPDHSEGLELLESPHLDESRSKVGANQEVHRTSDASAGSKPARVQQI